MEVVELLMDEQRFYKALRWMKTLDDKAEYSRLELRLSWALFYAGRTREALNRIEQSAPRMQQIYEVPERGPNQPVCAISGQAWQKGGLRTAV